MEGFMKGIEIQKTAFLVVQRCVLPLGVDTTYPIREHRQPGSLASCAWRETGLVLLLSLYFLESKSSFNSRHILSAYKFYSLTST